MRFPAAVLWDMDGTLVDTEPLWMAAENELVAESGGDWSQADALHLVGAGLLDAGAYMCERLALTMTPAEVVDYLITRVVRRMTQDGLQWQPGARELVAGFRAADVPQAMVTMSYTEVAAPVIEALGLTVAITGDEVSRPKPHPDPYLQAAEALGVDPADCLAVEDSITGAASANAAGCFVIGVPHAVQVPPAPRRVVIETLAGHTPHSLSTLVQ